MARPFGWLRLVKSDRNVEPRKQRLSVLDTGFQSQKLKSKAGYTEIRGHVDIEEGEEVYMEGYRLLCWLLRLSGVRHLRETGSGKVCE